MPGQTYTPAHGRTYAGGRATTTVQRTENDAIWLATGIFVLIVNIFVSLLNILGGD